MRPYNPYDMLEAAQRAYDDFARTVVRNYYEPRLSTEPPEMPASVQQVKTMLWENILRAKHACYEYEKWKHDQAKALEQSADIEV